MNTVKRIAKNTGVLLVSQIASYILGFFFIMYTARYLGAAGFGINPFCKQKAFTENASQQTLGKFDQNASQQTFRKSLIKMRCSFALAFTKIF